MFDLAFPSIPERLGDVPALVQMIDVCDQLETIQGAIGNFTRARGQGLAWIPVREPCFGRKQPQEFLKASGYFNKHLCIELPPLIEHGDPNTQTSEKQSPHLAELDKNITRKYHSFSEDPRQRQHVCAPTNQLKLPSRLRAIPFLRARRCQQPLSEDLAQEVMLIVYRKAAQLRDRTLFRPWLFKVARSSLCRYFGKQSREIETIEREKVTDRLVASTNPSAATPAFDYLHWMSFLDSREREALTLRFVEDRQYHEFASAKGIPIGTVQWRVFNVKRKLAPILKRRAIQDRAA